MSTHTPAAGRTNAFERIGTDVTAHQNAAGALAAAGLAGWNVRKVPLSFGAGQIVPRQYAVVRDQPDTDQLGYLGVVGDSYTPFQNEAIASVLDTVADEGGMRYAAAGALDGGSKVFVTLNMPESLVLHTADGQDDRTDWKLVAFSSHDGSAALKFAVTGIRVWCANQQSAVMRSAASSFTIRHTKNARFAIQAIREGLRLTHRYIEEFETEAADLYAEHMAIHEAERFVRDLFQVDAATTHAAHNSRRTKAAEVIDLYRTSPTIAPVAGTRWAAYNAVTEWADHVQSVSGPRHARTERRALRTLTSKTTHDIKARAFELLSA